MMTRLFHSPKGGFATDMDRILQDMFGPFVHRSAAGNNRGISLNTCEVDGGYRLDAFLPGVKIEDLEITVHDNVLTINGRWLDASDEAVTWHRQERPQGEFNRSIELPEKADAANIEATMDNGVLTVKIPTVAEEMPRKIEIKTRS